uniref:Uncharacterized protein n=1 Tax=Octopus bimaculoides TaxID=37653 RepID=A0A0L8FIA7_OCTBM
MMMMIYGISSLQKGTNLTLFHLTCFVKTLQQGLNYTVFPFCYKFVRSLCLSKKLMLNIDILMPEIET